jgi:hypothetical protein
MKYVLYHSNCYDGFGAAFAAWKSLGDDGVKYIPVSYGYPVPDMPDAEHIYIVDFSYSKDVILELVNQGTPVTVIDHHKTAQEALSELIGAHSHLTIIFDMEKSGALLTWNYFHSDTSAPILIQHISDRDLWQFKMEGSREIHSALVSLPFDFKVWDWLDVPTLIAEGKACQRFQQSVVDKVVKSSWMGTVDGNQVPIVNTSFAWSEVGEALNYKYPDAPFAASFTVFGDQIMWSLRSKGDFDVSAVAKKFGGGGHKNAAGFKAARY